jgi:hypothetical protein
MLPNPLIAEEAMPLRQNTTDSVRSALLALGLRRADVNPLIREIVKWEQAMGEVHTLKRIKQLKQVYLCSLAHTPYIQEGQSIGLRHDGLPKGAFGRILRAYQEKTALSVLNVYHSYVLTTVTEEQWKKFYTSATSDVVSPIDVVYRIPKGVKPWNYKAPISQIGDFYAAWRQGLTHLTLVRTSGARQRYVRRQEQLFRDTCMGLGTCGAWATEFKPQLRQLVGLLPNPAGRLVHHIEGTVGRLSYTQESGGKLRVFAVPFLPWQAALDDLKRFLFQQLMYIREDCTYDQDQGKLWCRNQLQAGRVVHSIDLSDATNHFPWSLQKTLLSSLKVPVVFQVAMERVSKGEYIIPSDVPVLPGEVNRDGVRRMVFRKGQPLGAGPSFALFAISHHALIQGCSAYAAGEDQYRILGDDIVIADSTLAQEYLAKLSEWNIPISKAKTFASRTMAEFAGSIITPNLTVSPWKWRGISPENFLDVVRNFKQIPTSILTRDQREIVGALWDVLEPLGFGHNPSGIPFETRYAQLLDLQEYLEGTRRDVRVVSQGQTWDAHDLVYGTELSCHETPFPRQAGLQAMRVVLEAEQRVKEVPYSPLESRRPRKISRLVGRLLH